MPKPPDSRASFRNAAGLDLHVLSTLLLRAWSVVAGAITVLLVPYWLDPVKQGYYYTFSSLLGLQVFFELGLNQVVVQKVGHEMAHLEEKSDGSLQGDRARIDKLVALVRLLRRWYGVAALLFIVLASSAGAYFLARQEALAPSAWMPAWVALVLATAGNLYLSPYLAVAEGSGKVGEVARLRLRQSLLSYPLMWSAFACGLDLLSMLLVPAIAFGGTLTWLHGKQQPLRWTHMASGTNPSEALRWGEEIFPLQWRIAVSWISGYFIFHLFTPLAFARQGPVEAGRLGLALALFNAISTTAISWISAKTPVFAHLVSLGQRAELNRLFIAALQRSALFMSTSIVLVLIILVLLSQAGMALVGRIASIPVLLCIAAATLANLFIFAAASYMRAHAEEPMLKVSVTGAVLITCSLYFTSRFDVFSMAFTYAFITALILLPWTLKIFRIYFRRAA